MLSSILLMSFLVSHSPGRNLSSDQLMRGIRNRDCADRGFALVNSAASHNDMVLVFWPVSKSARDSDAAGRAAGAGVGGLPECRTTPPRDASNPGSSRGHGPTERRQPGEL